MFNTYNYSNQIAKLSRIGMVSIIIYDVIGRVIRILAEEMMNEGEHQLQWDTRDENGNDMTSGIYFLETTRGDHSEVQRIIITK